MQTYAAILKSLTNEAAQKKKLEQAAAAKKRRAQRQRDKIDARNSEFLASIEQEFLVNVWRGANALTKSTLDDWQQAELDRAGFVVIRDDKSERTVNDNLQNQIPSRVKSIVERLELYPELDTSSLEADALSSIATSLESLLKRRASLSRIRERVPLHPSRLDGALRFVVSHLEEIDEIYTVRLMEAGFVDSSRAPPERRRVVLRNVIEQLGGDIAGLETSEITVVFAAARKSISLEAAAQALCVDEIPYSQQTPVIVALCARASFLTSRELGPTLVLLESVEPAVRELLVMIKRTRSLSNKLNFDDESLAIGYCVSAECVITPSRKARVWKKATRLSSSDGRKAIETFRRMIEREAREGRQQMTFEVVDQEAATWLKPFGRRASVMLPLALKDLEGVLSAEGLTGKLTRYRGEIAQWNLRWFS